MIDPEKFSALVDEILKERGWSLRRLSLELSCEYSQLYRLKSGQIRKLNKEANKLCNYAGISPDSILIDADSRTSTHLFAIIEATWDGSESHARLIARVVRALKIR